MKPFIIILHLLFQIPVFAQEWMEDKEDLTGQIKSVHYSSVSGDQQSTWYVTYNYNHNGFLTKSSSSESSQGPESNGIYRVYDEQQSRCLIQYVMFDGDTLKKYFFEYDNLGRVEKTKLYDSGTLWSTWNYVYDEAGLVRECFVVFKRDNDTNRTVYEYDEFGHKIRDTEMSVDFGQVKTWTYSKDGNLLEEKSELLKSPGYIVVKMNNDGTIAEEKNLDINPDDDRNYQISYIYNESGRLVKEVKKYLDGRHQYTKTFTYLANGMIDTEQYLTESGNKIDQWIKYEYDSHGNWIKKTEYWDGKVENTKKQVIEYY